MEHELLKEELEYSEDKIIHLQEEILGLKGKIKDLKNKHRDEIRHLEEQIYGYAREELRQQPVNPTRATRTYRTSGNDITFTAPDVGHYDFQVTAAVAPTGAYTREYTGTTAIWTDQVNALQDLNTTIELPLEERAIAGAEQQYNIARNQMEAGPGIVVPEGVTLTGTAIGADVYAGFITTTPDGAPAVIPNPNFNWGDDPYGGTTR